MLAKCTFCGPDHNWYIRSTKGTGFIIFLLSPTGLVNELVAVHPNRCIPQVVCQFLNRPIAIASCEISFSTDPTYANLTNTDLANSTNIANVTVPLSTKLRPNTLYYYDVLAVGDSMPIRIKGNFTTGMFIIFFEHLQCMVQSLHGYITCVYVCTCKANCKGVVSPVNSRSSMQPRHYQYIKILTCVCVCV